MRWPVGSAPPGSALTWWMRAYGDQDCFLFAEQHGPPHAIRGKPVRTQSPPTLAAAAGSAARLPSTSICIPRWRAPHSAAPRWAANDGATTVVAPPCGTCRRGRVPPFCAPRAGRVGRVVVSSHALDCTRWRMRSRLPNCMRVAFRKRMALLQSTRLCWEARARSTAVWLAHSAEAGSRPLFAQRRLTRL